MESSLQQSSEPHDNYNPDFELPPYSPNTLYPNYQNGVDIKEPPAVHTSDFPLHTNADLDLESQRLKTIAAEKLEDRIPRGYGQRRRHRARRGESRRMCKNTIVCLAVFTAVGMIFWFVVRHFID